jgi:tellurium resistance protein TerD
MLQNEFKLLLAQNYARILSERYIMAKGKVIKCPKCKSLDVAYFGGGGKKSRMAGAAIGGVLLGPIGIAGGLIGGGGSKKTQMRCNACGRTWSDKLK